MRAVMDWRWFQQGKRSVPQSYIVRSDDVDAEYAQRSRRWQHQPARLPAPRIVDVDDELATDIDGAVQRLSDLSADLGWTLEPWQCNALRQILSVGQTMRHYASE